MRRKVIQIADSTQLVSLPRKWALKHGIKKGDELDIEEQGSKIIVSCESTPEFSSVEIDVTDLDRTSILYYIEILYRLGYDEIKLKFSNPQAEHYRLNKKENVISIIHYVASRLISMEVIQQKDNFAILKNLEEISNKEFDTVLKRIFILLQDASDDFLSGIKKGDLIALETIVEKHDSIAKFISYGMRIVNKKGSGDKRNSKLLFHILNQLDKVTDILKYSARELIDNKRTLSKDAYDIIEGVCTSIKWYSEFFFKFNTSRIKELYSNRHNIIKKIRDKSNKLKPEELLLVEYFRHILEFIVDMTEARMGLEY